MRFMSLGTPADTLNISISAPGVKISLSPPAYARCALIYRPVSLRSSGLSTMFISIRCVIAVYLCIFSFSHSSVCPTKARARGLAESNALFNRNRNSSSVSFSSKCASSSTQIALFFCSSPSTFNAFWSCLFAFPR